MVESELRAKLDEDISLSWQELRASVTSRAESRSCHAISMVGGGMALADAVAISGLMVEED